MKEQKIGAGVPVGDRGGGDPLERQVINIMEQGVLVWGPDGRCLMFNARVYPMLEIGVDTLNHDTMRADFRARSVARGDISQASLELSERAIAAHQPYSFDRTLPSGRVVLTTGRPMRGGGTVVTLTDVTEARRVQQELARAKAESDAAEQRTLDILAQERIRRTEGRLLGQLNEWLQSCKSLDELYMVVERFMRVLLPGSKGELYIYSNSRDVLDGMVKWNTRDLHPNITADSCWALRRGRSYEYDEDGLCLSCDHVTGHHHGVAVREYICVPIVAHGDTVGLLHARFDTDSPGSARLGDKGAFAIRCGEHISMAIANARLRDELRDQSIRDPLTGLYNRRYFMDAIHRELSISSRRGSRFGLISFDADRFKTFNDNHGHDAGDLVLRGIGARMHDILTAGEIGCRYGGEEFMVLVPAADLGETVALAERLRDSVSDLQVRHLDSILPKVTISCGAAAYPECGTDIGDLLRRADEALYAAKQAGRNAVAVPPNGTPPPAAIPPPGTG
ncbi:MAG: diguanylate cyclase [Rubellimicrobium sp.]|nr:diguanylate cyclase [Rubellimicrobium sp.]